MKGYAGMRGDLLRIFAGRVLTVLVSQSINRPPGPTDDTIFLGKFPP